MSVSYSGEVIVEDKGFTMKFERFIIRENEIAIQGSGRDEYGYFEFGGKGQKDKLGQYNILTKLVYTNLGDKLWEGQGVIVIKIAKETPKKQKCTVEGTWSQDGDSWEFQEELKVIKA